MPSSITPKPRSIFVGRGPAFVDLDELVDLDAEPVGQHLDHAAPRERQHARDQQQRLGVERLAEAHRLEQHRRLLVVLVVHDLHDAQLLDVLARAR